MNGLSLHVRSMRLGKTYRWWEREGRVSAWCVESSTFSWRLSMLVFHVWMGNRSDRQFRSQTKLWHRRLTLSNLELFFFVDADGNRAIRNLIREHQVRSCCRFGLVTLSWRLKSTSVDEECGYDDLQTLLCVQRACSISNCLGKIFPRC